MELVFRLYSPFPFPSATYYSPHFVNPTHNPNRDGQRQQPRILGTTVIERRAKSQRHKRTDDQYPGDNCISKMANVRGLLVLSLVCLLLCQMMSLSEACAKKVKCHENRCGDFCCHPGNECNGCGCLKNGVIYPSVEC
ncbi:hypothetical protein LSAT2_024607 [Lamellibrachia satsuma]|nr:hypothetical protein LSAT2_024607 [Lamellibrachia satsuma]